MRSFGPRNHGNVRTRHRTLAACFAVLFSGIPMAGSMASPPPAAYQLQSEGHLHIIKVDANGRPFLSPGATISIRRVTDAAPGHRFAFNDYGPSFGPAQTESSAALRAGTYEIGLQIPDGFSVDMSGCISCTGGARQATFTQSSGTPQPPILLTMTDGFSESLTFTFKRRLAPDASLADTSEKLRCNIAGVPAPMPPTDVLTFKGSDSWVEVGLNRTIGDIVVTLDLINPQAPDSPVSLIDARSAGGAAWQTSFGGIDAQMREIVHFNQGAGNSARVWGYEAPLSATQEGGFVQQSWVPLFSVDHRPAGAKQSESVGTSPCYNTGIRIGDGKFSLAYQRVAAGPDSTITRLLYGYALRHRISSSWDRFQFDYGIYFNPRNRDMRLYFPVRNRVVGPIYPYEDMSATPRDEVRNVVCEAGDCLIATPPIPYALLVWNVHGRDIAIAIHTVNPAGAFDGFIRFRPHVQCEGGGVCGGVQWHSEVQDTGLHPDQKHIFQAGEILRYQLVYDIGTPAQLARLGFLSH